MPNEMPGSGMQVQLNMGTPSVGLNQAPNWGGTSMDPHTVVPLLPSQCFSARGRGAQSLTLEANRGPRVNGPQGSLDLLILTGAAGTARTVCFLTDNPASPTRYIAIKIDTSNRPLVQLTNNLGTVVAAVTPSYTAIPAGRTVTIRLAWDSQNMIDPLTSTRRVSLRVNREFVPGTDWTTDPTANWTHFQPTHLVLGASLSDADFNGIVSAFQASNVVLP